MRILQHDGRQHVLRRWPERRDEQLQAWDAADAYLLQDEGAAAPGRLLIINDNFGALAVVLAERRPVVWSDSHLSRMALEQNLQANDRRTDDVEFIPADQEPEGVFDTVLARFPKSLAAWEDTLLRLRPRLHETTRIVVGGMIKHTPRRAFDLMDRVIGPTRTGPGWKKARLAFTTVDPARELPGGVADTEYGLQGQEFTVRTAPGVFAREHLDNGTRVLLPHLPQDQSGRLADIGCGNGVLSLALTASNPGAEVLGTDESYRAVACARANALRAGFGPDRVAFEATDGLDGAAAASFDWVVTNPPFHQDRTLGDALAWSIFSQAHRGLVAGGRLLVVGNRHLDHGRRLDRVFGNWDRLDETDKFEVLQSVKR